MIEPRDEKVFSHAAVLCLLPVKLKNCVTWMGVCVISSPRIAPVKVAVLSVSVCQNMSLTSFPASAAQVVITRCPPLTALTTHTY